MRESRKGYAGNQPRHVVADAPNGYFSGSLGKRVSKPTLSSSNDRSSAMCRFESCRPHQYFLSRALLVGTGRHAALKTRCSFERAGSNPAERTTDSILSRPWLELEYTLRSKRSAFGHAGSSPAGRTTFCGSLAQLARASGSYPAG